MRSVLLVIASSPFLPSSPFSLLSQPSSHLPNFYEEKQGPNRLPASSSLPFFWGKAFSLHRKKRGGEAYNEMRKKYHRFLLLPIFFIILQAFYFSLFVFPEYILFLSLLLCTQKQKRGEGPSSSFRGRKSTWKEEEEGKERGVRLQFFGGGGMTAAEGGREASLEIGKGGRPTTTIRRRRRRHPTLHFPPPLSPSFEKQKKNRPAAEKKSNSHIFWIDSDLIF